MHPSPFIFPSCIAADSVTSSAYCDAAGAEENDDAETASFALLLASCLFASYLFVSSLFPFSLVRLAFVFDGGDDTDGEDIGMGEEGNDKEGVEAEDEDLLRLPLLPELAL